LAVGIGKGLKNGHLDANRPLVLHYLVRTKIKNPKKAHRVKEKVTLEIGSGKKPKRITLATDVIEIGNMVPTAATVDSDSERFSSGYLVSWSQGWGFLTVGHGLAGNAQGFARVTYGATVSGRVLATTSPDDSIDAALIEVLPEQVQQLFGPIITSASPSLYFRPFTQLVSDTQTHVYSTMEYMNGVKPLQLISFFSDAGATGPLIPALPGLTNLFFAQSEPQVFVPGVSGAAWLLSPHVPAAMQVAGNDPNFNHGFGVSLELLLRWAATQVQDQVRLRAIL
jgi:hypothetical protein